jgi:hypothetical protein
MPTTPGGAATPSGTGASSGGGSIPKVVRGRSAKTVLKLGWEYPAYVEPKVDKEGQSVAAKLRRALPRAEAIAYISANDPRPLLVLRECKVCNGTDDALLSRGNVDNERTFLLSRWFHCVKLPVAVMEKDHPFHNLFADENPEHMFLCSADGSVRVPMESERSRVELWNAMTTVLKATYAKEPEDVVKRMAKTIDDFDMADQKIDTLEQKIDQLLETEGPDSRKLKKVREELGVAQKQRDELFRAIEVATAELKLKKLAEARTEPKPLGS